VSRIEVQWPSGQTDKLLDIAADQTITIKEGVGMILRKQFDKRALPELKTAGTVR
jgi:hypothetical protein